jgi:IS30 family transposase
MEQIQSSTKRRGYEQIKERERYKIEVLLADKRSVRNIANLLKRHRSTIYREKQRGSVKLLDTDLKEKERYRADVAQRESEKRGRERERELKIGHDRELESYIRERIKEKRHSPDAIIGGICKQGLKFKGMICTKTLYNYIGRGVFAGISNEQLWEKGRRSKRTYRQIGRTSVTNRLGRSIEERSEEINRREAYGHWEGDTVKGPQGKLEVLLTLTERQSREECIIKLKQGTQAAIKAAFDDLEEELGENFSLKFKSMTLDNGSEFLDASVIEMSCLKPGEKRTEVYFAHPYSAWERGTNENHNRIIRRFIPKGKDIARYSKKEIAGIQEWMNNYPRKILGYLTPNQVAATHLYGNS